ncbi:hypothetical protein ACWDBW_30260 [Streptomyces sp. NPDC001107]
MAKHARRRKHDKKEAADDSERVERGERTMLVIRIAVLIIELARFLDGGN